MADAEAGIVNAGAEAELPSYGAADTLDKSPPFDSIPGDDPPSYASVMQDMKDAKKNSSGVVDFITKLTTILLNTIAFTILMALILLVPIIMVVIGGVHINNCPVQKLIPIFLIVSGSIHILKTILDLNVRYRKRKQAASPSGGETSYARENAVSRMLGLALLIFFILGNVWVYANFRPDEDPSSLRYCQPTLYYFSFWIITLAYIFLVLGCCCACCTISVIGIGLGS